MAEPTKNGDGAKPGSAAERLHMKAVREEARRQFKAMLQELGVESTEELREMLAGTGVDREETKVPTPKVDAKALEDEKRAAIEDAKAEAALRETLLDSGVKRRDLDYAVIRFKSRVESMSDADLAAFDVPDFVTELAADAPMVFADGRLPKREPTEAEKQAAREAEEKARADAEKAKADSDKAKADAEAAKVGTADVGVKAAAANSKIIDPPPFHAMNATKEQVAAAMERVKALRGTARVIDAV